MDEEFSWNSSYVYGVDKESGWGGRYFFTYYSQFDDRPPPIVTIEVLILTIIFFVSLVANGTIVVCVFKFPDMRTVTNCFVLNLAAADILFALTIPFVAYTRIVSAWNLGDTVCRLVPYIQLVSGVVLLWTLSLISIDRHRCIVVPPYRSKMTPKQAVLFSTITWLTTILFFIPVALWFRQIEANQTKICTLIFPKSNTMNYSLCFIVPLLLFACLLPMLLLVYHYQQIFRKILSTKNAWASSCVVISAVEVNKGCPRTQIRRQSELSVTEIFVPWPRRFSAQLSNNGTTNALKNRTGSLSHHEEIRLNKHIKVVRVLFLNVVVVLVMWLPITLIMLLIYIDGSRSTNDRNFFLRSYHFLICLIVALLNTCINPLLYGVLSDNFRSCLKRIWPFNNKGSLELEKEHHTPSSNIKIQQQQQQQQQQLQLNHSGLNSVSEHQNE